jgi:hypothetical protein
MHDESSDVPAPVTDLTAHIAACDVDFRERQLARVAAEEDFSDEADQEMAHRLASCDSFGQEYATCEEFFEALASSGEHSACERCNRGVICDHPQSHLTVGVMDTCVDELLAPLLQLLAARGCRTRFSCQGTPDDAYVPAHIVFADGASFDLALHELWAVLHKDAPEVAERMQGLCRRDRKPAGAWRHDAVIPAYTQWGADLPQVGHMVFLPHADLLVINAVISRVR